MPGPHPRPLELEFIETHNNGFEALAANLRAASWDEIERPSGPHREDLETVAKVYVKSSATIVTYGMGITQDARGTSNVQQIANLLLMRGNMGKPRSLARRSLRTRRHRSWAT
jgi:anaerobic selenocysteine-containing dehydrogenase